MMVRQLLRGAAIAVVVLVALVAFVGFIVLSNGIR